MREWAIALFASFLTVANSEATAELGEGIEAFLEEFGESQERVVRSDEIQYVWVTADSEIVVNVRSDQGAASITFVRYGPDARFPLAEIVREAELRFPEERFRRLAWGNVDGQSGFLLTDDQRDTIVNYRTNHDASRPSAQLLFFVRNLNRPKKESSNQSTTDNADGRPPNSGSLFELDRLSRRV